MSRKQWCIVLDTYVFIAALRSSRGAASRILELILSGAVVVTNNLRHLPPPAKHFGIEVLSPADFLTSLTKEKWMAIGEHVISTTEAERLENQQCAAVRHPLADAKRREAIEILHRGGDNPPEPGDEIPMEFLAWARRTAEAEAAEAASRPTKPRSRA